MSRPPRITRVHVTALLLKDPGRSALVVHSDGKVEITTPARFIDGGEGRMILTGTELLESGVQLTKSGSGTLAAGSGPIVDDILDETNTYLRTHWPLTPAR